MALALAGVAVSGALGPSLFADRRLADVASDASPTTGFVNFPVCVIDGVLEAVSNSEGRFDHFGASAFDKFDFSPVVQAERLNKTARFAVQHKFFAGDHDAKALKHG